MAPRSFQTTFFVLFTAPARTGFIASGAPPDSSLISLSSRIGFDGHIFVEISDVVQQHGPGLAEPADSGRLGPVGSAIGLAEVKETASLATRMPVELHSGKPIP
jgi:hypothetical protein